MPELAEVERTKTIPVTIAFNDITYEILTKKPGTPEKKVYRILDGISGTLAPGSLTAIMGPTGSGKTSLLNVLANRMPAVKGAELRGQLLINGRNVASTAGASRFARLSAYVMQDDALNPFLTVRETLSLAASFQLPPTTTEDERASLVRVVAAELGLNKVIDSLIGDDKVRGVSGGERKRANIGVELIKNPSALYLDEPTSGLDSFQAQSVMECLSGLAARGRTVVSSIHQPRSSIFKMFQQLVLVTEGKCVFFGEASKCVDYFANISPSFACPPLFNPADWFLDITSPDYRSSDLEAASLHRIQSLETAWRERDQQGATSSSDLEVGAIASGELANTASADSSSSGKEDAAEELPTFQSTWARQFSLVYWRSWTSLRRNKGILKAKFIPPIFFSLVLGAVYSNVGRDQRAIQDRTGVLFFFTINQTFPGVFATINTFMPERTVVARERAAKSYRLSAFYCGKVCAELPLNLCSPLLFSVIVYWLVGLNESPTRFACFIVLILLTGLAGIGLGMIIASAFSSVEAALAVGPIAVIVMILFGGFYINIESLPPALHWIQNLSIMRWSFQGLMVNEFGSNLDVGGNGGGSGGTTFNCRDVDTDAGETCITEGDEVIKRLNFDGDSVRTAMFALLGFVVGSNLIAYMILRFFKKRSYQRLSDEGGSSPVSGGSSQFQITKPEKATTQPVVS